MALWMDADEMIERFAREDPFDLSIEKFERVVKFPDQVLCIGGMNRLNSSTCALCKTYLGKGEDRCIKCPLHKIPRGHCCTEDSFWVKVWDTAAAYRKHSTDIYKSAFVSASKEMLAALLEAKKLEEHNERQ